MEFTDNLARAAQFSLFITPRAVTREETYLKQSIFCLSTDREGVDRARGVWEIPQPAVKDGEVSRAPCSPPPLHVARKSQGEGEGSQVCSEELRKSEKGISGGYSHSRSNTSTPLLAASLLCCKNATLSIFSLPWGEAATSRFRLLHELILRLMPWDSLCFLEAKT